MWLRANIKELLRKDQKTNSLNDGFRKLIKLVNLK